MVQPVVTLNERTSVRTLIETLNSNNHHGFPVIRSVENGLSSFVGLALRSQVSPSVGLCLARVGLAN